jgi:eukaryotic-like serine/threonine-protein kinase
MSRNCIQMAGVTRAVRPARKLVMSALLATCAVGLIAIGPAMVRAEGDTPAAKAAAADVKLAAPMAVEWKYTGPAFPGNVSSPVVSSDSVYFASGGRVYAVNLQTGGLKWRYPYDGFMAAAVTNTLVISGDTLLVPTGDGLYALNTADGKLKYPAFKLNKGGVATTPAVVGDNVYFGSHEGKLYGLNIQTGELLGGAYKNGLSAGGDFAGDMTSADGIVYFITTNSALHAVDAAAGSQRWGQVFNGIAGLVTPVVSGETLFVASGQSLVNYRASTGQMRWLLTTHNDITAPPAVDSDGNVYIVTSDRGVYAIDSLRKLLWKKPPHTDYEVDTQPVVANDLVIVGTSAGAIYAYDRATGDLKWNYAIRPTSSDPNNVPVDNKVTARPVAAGDGLFVLTDDGCLTTFRHDAFDTLPPVVDHLDPEPGDYLNGRPPFEISAHIQDDGSGLKVDTISLKVDNQMIARRLTEEELITKPGFLFNTDDGILKYTIIENDSGRSQTLADGHHTATIIASDWKGNTVTKTWTFYIDDALKPRAKKKAPGTTLGKGGPGGRGGPGSGTGDVGGKGGGGGGGGS